MEKGILLTRMVEFVGQLLSDIDMTIRQIDIYMQDGKKWRSFGRCMFPIDEHQRESLCFDFS